MLDEHDRLLSGASTRGQQGVEPYDEGGYDQQEDFNGEIGSK